MTALMAVALAGCGLLPINTGDTGFRVINRRDAPITFTVEDAAVHTTDGSQAVGPESVPPHQETFVPTQGCRGTGARATDENGNEIGRLDTPLCKFDAWIFEADGTARVERADA